MNIIEQWINELGLVKSDLQTEYYNYQKNDEILLASIDDIEYKKRTILTDGLDEHRTKRILSGIMDNALLPAIEVIQSDNKGYRYILYHGYHRFSTCKFLDFTHIPIKIVEKINF